MIMIAIYEISFVILGWKIYLAAVKGLIIIVNSNSQYDLINKCVHFYFLQFVGRQYYFNNNRRASDI